MHAYIHINTHPDVSVFTIWVELVNTINFIRKALTAEIAEQPS